MQFYFFIILFFFLLTYASLDKDIFSIKYLFLKYCYIISFFLLFILSAFRYGIETDFFAYEFLYNNDNSSVEPSFNLFVTVIKKIWDNFSFFIFCWAFISMFTKYNFFKCLKNPQLGYFIFFCFFYINLEWNILRQGLAISFLLLSINFVEKKKFLPFLFFVGLATSIHISSIIFLPVFFINNRSLSLKRIFYITVILLFIKYFVLNYFIDAFIGILHRVTGGALFIYTQRIEGYLKLTTNKRITFGFVRRFIIILFYFILSGKKKDKNLYLNIYFVGFIIYTLFMGNEVLSTRISLPYEVSMVGLFGNISFCKRINLNYIFLTFTVLCLLIFIVMIRGGNAIPYISIFNI